MINITELKEEDRGRRVRYKSSVPGKAYEYGTITSWNDSYVFIDYYNTGGRGTATSPDRLDFDDENLSVDSEGKLKSNKI